MASNSAKMSEELDVSNFYAPPLHSHWFLTNNRDREVIFARLHELTENGGRIERNRDDGVIINIQEEPNIVEMHYGNHDAVAWVLYRRIRGVSTSWHDFESSCIPPPMAVLKNRRNQDTNEIWHPWVPSEVASADRLHRAPKAKGKKVALTLDRKPVYFNNTEYFDGDDKSEPIGAIAERVAFNILLQKGCHSILISPAVPDVDSKQHKSEKADQKQGQGRRKARDRDDPFVNLPEAALDVKIEDFLVAPSLAKSFETDSCEVRKIESLIYSLRELHQRFEGRMCEIVQELPCNEDGLLISCFKNREGDLQVQLYAKDYWMVTLATMFPDMVLKDLLPCIKFVGVIADEDIEGDCWIEYAWVPPEKDGGNIKMPSSLLRPLEPSSSSEELVQNEWIRSHVMKTKSQPNFIRGFNGRSVTVGEVSERVLSELEHLSLSKMDTTTPPEATEVRQGQGGRRRRKSRREFNSKQHARDVAELKQGQGQGQGQGGDTSDCDNRDWEPAAAGNHPFINFLKHFFGMKCQSTIWNNTKVVVYAIVTDRTIEAANTIATSINLNPTLAGNSTGSAGGTNTKKDSKGPPPPQMKPIRPHKYCTFNLDSSDYYLTYYSKALDKDANGELMARAVFHEVNSRVKGTNDYVILPEYLENHVDVSNRPDDQSLVAIHTSKSKPDG